MILRIYTSGETSSSERGELHFAERTVNGQRSTVNGALSNSISESPRPAAPSICCSSPQNQQSLGLKISSLLILYVLYIFAVRTARPTESGDPCNYEYLDSRREDRRYIGGHYPPSTRLTCPLGRLVGWVGWCSVPTHQWVIPKAKYSPSG